MKEKINIKKLSNGMVIIGIPMQQVQSVSFVFQLPCGAAMLPENCCGAAAVIEDWLFRGTETKTSREITEQLDFLGLHRNSSTGAVNMTLAGATQADNLRQAVDVYGDIILKPLLDGKQFEFSKQLALHDLAGLDDDPRQQTMLMLKENFYPQPFGQSSYGKKDDLKNLTAEKCRKIVSENFNISQAVFAVAGKFDFESACSQIEKLFGSEKQRPAKNIQPTEQELKYHHKPYDGAQVHIGIMTPTVVCSNENYYKARLAVAVLSGGMGARLFTEVREKRGLCYAVGASYNSLKNAAGIACYAGTTPDKAQQTYDVIISEFKKLSGGISDDEMQRAKTGLLSTLVMQSESTAARAKTAAGDYQLLGKIRTIEEIKNNIEKINADSITEFLKQNPFEKFCTATIGSSEIKAL